MWRRGQQPISSDQALEGGEKQTREYKIFLEKLTVDQLVTKFIAILAQKYPSPCTDTPSTGINSEQAYFKAILWKKREIEENFTTARLRAKN